jgi:hypothetical protein
MQRSLFSAVISVFLLGVTGLTLQPVGAARPFRQKTMPVAADPSPVGARDFYCEGMRKEIEELNQIKPAFRHFFYRPRIGRLKAKHFNCLNKYAEMDRRYLKTIPVQSAPQATQNSQPSKSGSTKGSAP